MYMRIYPQTPINGGREKALNPFVFETPQKTPCKIDDLSFLQLGKLSPEAEGGKHERRKIVVDDAKVMNESVEECGREKC